MSAKYPTKLKRTFPTEILFITPHKIEEVDLSSLALGDTIDRVGAINDYAVLGFLYNLEVHGIGLFKRDEQVVAKSNAGIVSESRVMSIGSMTGESINDIAHWLIETAKYHRCRVTVVFNDIPLIAYAPGQDRIQNPEHIVGAYQLMGGK